MTTGELREIIENVIKALEAGHSQRAACIMNGVTVANLNAWQRRDDMGDPEFHGLRARVEKASLVTLLKLEKAYLKACSGQEIQDPETGEIRHAPPDVKAIQWYLSRRHWRDYDPTVVLARESLDLQRQQALASLSTPEVQALFIDMLKSDPELKKKAREALGEADDDDA